MRQTLLNAELIFGLAGPAHAVIIVGPDTKVHFQFDVSALGAISFDSAAYDCFRPDGPTGCPSGDPNRLDSLASFQLDFGSTLGNVLSTRMIER